MSLPAEIHWEDDIPSQNNGIARLTLESGVLGAITPPPPPNCSRLIEILSDPPPGIILFYHGVKSIMSVLKFRLPNIIAISGRDSGYVLTHSPAHIRSQGERERER